jgi:hypothetical protein
MIRGIEGGNGRGARLTDFVSARFRGSVGEYEVMKENACSQQWSEGKEEGCRRPCGQCAAGSGDPSREGLPSGALCEDHRRAKVTIWLCG